MVIQEQNKILQDTIIYYNEKKNKEILPISRPIFNKINEDKKLISLRMLRESIKELSNQKISDEESEFEEEEEVFIN